MNYFIRLSFFKITQFSYQIISCNHPLILIYIFSVLQPLHHDSILLITAIILILIFHSINFQYYAQMLIWVMLTSIHFPQLISFSFILQPHLYLIKIRFPFLTISSEIIILSALFLQICFLFLNLWLPVFLHFIFLNLLFVVLKYHYFIFQALPIGIFRFHFTILQWILPFNHIKF